MNRRHAGIRHGLITAAIFFISIRPANRTDSFTIIVSEETGNVSYAMGGELPKGVTPTELREQLHLIQDLPHKQDGEDGKGKRWIRRRKKERAGES